MRGTMKKTIHQNLMILTAGLMAALTSSCGKNYREITLLTPIPVANPTQNLASVFNSASGGSNSLMAIGVGDLTNSCHQTEFRAGYAIGPDSGPTEIIRVALDTELLSTGKTLNNLGLNTNTYAATDWLNSHSVLRAPIRFKIPTNTEVTVGFRGVLYEPLQLNGSNLVINTSGSDCKKLDPNNNMNDPVSFIINGIQRVTANANTVEIKPFVLKSTGFSPPGYTLPSISSGNIANPSPVSENTILCFNQADSKSCPNRELIKVEVTVPTGVSLMTITAKNFPIFGERSISHTIRVSASGTTIFYIAREKKITLSYAIGPFEKTMIIDSASPKNIYDTSAPSLVNAMYSAGSNTFYACLPANLSSNLTIPNSTYCISGTPTSYVTLKLDFIGTEF